MREDDGKLIALQFPVQDAEFWDGVEKTYEKLKQQACFMLLVMVIQKVIFTLIKATKE